jgi:hypothetical protein
VGRLISTEIPLSQQRDNKIQAFMDDLKKDGMVNCIVVVNYDHADEQFNRGIICSENLLECHKKSGELLARMIVQDLAVEQLKKSGVSK